MYTFTLRVTKRKCPYLNTVILKKRNLVDRKVESSTSQTFFNYLLLEELDTTLCLVRTHLLKTTDSHVITKYFETKLQNKLIIYNVCVQNVDVCT